MSSNSQLSASFPPAKSNASSSSSNSAPLSQPGLPSSGNEPQRRSGGGGAAGASVLARNILGAPRGVQVGRKSHKNHRKPNTPRYGEEQIDEVAMALPTGRKGTSITHLMNWNVAAPRSHMHNDYRRSTRRTPTWGLGSGYHAVDKARFINANYRFLVHPRGDYRAQAVDSDVHLPWDLVLQVLASEQTQMASCPICLSTPVAPRMAKCGHIFCLPCLLRYMASIEDTKHQHQGPAEKKPRSKKCVICMDNVYISETRPVRFFMGQENPTPREGEDVVLRLVMRRQGSTLALPKDGADAPEALEEIPWHFAAEVMDYARVMKGTEDYMEEQYTREIDELEQMEREDEVMFGEDGEWTRKAVAAIKLAREGMKGMGNPPRVAVELPKEKEKEKENKPEIVFNENEDDVPAFYHMMHEASSGHSSSTGSRSQSTTPSQQPSEAPPESNTVALGKRSTTSELSSSIAAARSSQLRADIPYFALPSDTPSHDAPYFFYQSLLHYYLSSLDIRILRAAFGSYVHFPSTILPRVENVTTGHSVDDDLRKRAKYLAHLPAGCEVGFLECDWTDVVPPEILERFRSEIERRRRKKLEKETKEERDRVRAEKEEEAAHRLRRRGEGNGKGWSEDEWVALAEQESLVESQPFADHGEGNNSAPPPLGTSPLYSEADGSQLQEGSFVSPGTSPSQDRVPSSRTVWGTPLVLPHGASGVSAAPLQREETGGWQDWERDFLDDDTLAQLEGGGRAPASGKGGKKKKFKKVTLMTNGGKRGA